MGESAPVHRHSTVHGHRQPEEQRGQRALAAPTRSDEREHLPCAHLQVDALENEARAARVGEGDVLEPDRAVARGHRCDESRRGTRSRSLEELEQPFGNRDSVGARVVLGGEVAERQVELGGEDEDGHSRLEPDVAVDELDADRHGDERDSEGRGELEDGARKERNPQRLHRRVSIALARLGDRGSLRTTAVVRAQGGEAANDVQEMCRQHRERTPARPRALLRIAADQRHEQRDEGKSQHHDERGGEVEWRDPRDDRQRHDDGENELRQETREVGLERCEAVDGCGGDLAALGAVEGRRLLAQAPFDELEPELRENPDRAEPSGDLEAPNEHRPESEREGE